MQYTIHRAVKAPPLDGNWDHPAWSNAATLEVAHFHPRSSDHRPVTQARVLYDNSAIYVFFKVQDRYVRSVATQYQDSVCKDACVEFFVQPGDRSGYFNFEMNCGGVVLLYYIEDPEIVGGRFKKQGPVDKAHFDRMRIYHSMPLTVPEELPGPLEWKVAYSIPLDLIEAHVGPLGELAGQRWRGNFYKCASDTSHPHWACWSPIEEQLNFHQPRYFGDLEFAR